MNVPNLVYTSLDVGIPYFPAITNFVIEMTLGACCNSALGAGSALCSPVPMFPEPIFPGSYSRVYVPRYLGSPVPMFPDFVTLILDFSINR